MGIRKFKPTTPGRRTMAISDFADITTDKPCKALLAPLKKSGGRRNTGRVSIWHRGGGHKRRYRIIDFRREKLNVPAKVATIEYDPNRSARIALLYYKDGEKRYILAPKGLKVGDILVSSDQAIDVKPGNAMLLSLIPTGVEIHNVELKPGKGGQLARSAGNVAVLEAKEGNYAQVRMPSGKKRLILLTCRATIGQVGNVEHENITHGKAGRRRWLGRRPRVRAVAMNPVDHPMGGGEGKTSGGRHPCNAWGVPAKGYKTRRNKRTDKYQVKK